MSYFKFSGGEVHARPAEQPFIRMRDYSMDGFMALCQQNEILRRSGARATVEYRYLPYARQDRVMVDEPFSLKTFCELVNLQDFAEVIVHDPHSDVGPALLNNCRVVPQWELARQVIPEEWFQSALFVSPDAGAYKKVSQLVDGPVAIGLKVRERGKIVRSEVLSPISLEGRDCMIVDDICDGGRTFVALAAKLKERGVAKVGLYVTHGIFANGFDELGKNIDAIFTTDSFQHNEVPDFVTVKEVP
jgi:ribose-phosphate pyrophosphokinase